MGVACCCRALRDGLVLQPRNVCLLWQLLLLLLPGWHAWEDMAAVQVLLLR